MVKLCVITGAGASNGAAGESTASTSLIDGQWRPPLTSELFASRPTFDQLLASYPPAYPLIHRMRGWIASENTVSLESRLSGIYRSGDSRERKQLKYLTYYLWKLIYEVSRRYMKGSPSNYDRLVDEILRRDLEVMFLTLNYDLFLEEALRSYESVTFNNVQAYFPEGASWRIIKLHGSANWGRKLLDQPAGLSLLLSSRGPSTSDGRGFLLTDSGWPTFPMNRAKTRCMSNLIPVRELSCPFQLEGVGVQSGLPTDVNSSISVRTRWWW